jgi:hypothetical protein
LCSNTVKQLLGADNRPFCVAGHAAAIDHGEITRGELPIAQIEWLFEPPVVICPSQDAIEILSLGFGTSAVTTKIPDAS